MSGTNRPNTTLTRRSFLRATGAAAGTLGVAGAAGMFAADDWLAPTEAYAEPEEHAPTPITRLTAAGIAC